MGKPSQRAEQEELRARMRAVGMAHDEIAVEFARRYRLRPRAAYRVAHGWTQQQAAGHINTHGSRIGLDPEGAASMTAPWLSELENWPLPARRRLTPQILAVLAAVYGTDVHNLLDLDDREHLAPEHMLVITRMRRSAPPPPPAQAGPEVLTAGQSFLSNSMVSLPGPSVLLALGLREQDPYGRTRAALGDAEERLVGAVGGLPPRLDEAPAGLVERMVTMAARESANFSRAADRGQVGQLTVEQFHEDLAWLATRYRTALSPPRSPRSPSCATTHSACWRPSSARTGHGICM